MDESVREVHVERYYPSVVAPAKEFKAIAAVVNPELNLVWRRMWQLFWNTFVYGLDETGAKRWESMLKLRPQATDDLESRRRRILAKINAQIPYTYRRMVQMLDVLCGAGLYDIDLDYNAYRLSILINPDTTNGINRISKMLYPIIPANLALFLAMRMYQEWPIVHKAASQQCVDAHHTIWNLGTLHNTMRDGEFVRGAVIRYGGIYPDENYRDSQPHDVDIKIYTQPRQYSRFGINARDGCFCFDGSHQRQGLMDVPLALNLCTITNIRNGMEGVTEAL